MPSPPGGPAVELGSPRGQAESLPLLGRKQRSESVEEGLAVRQSCPEAAEPCHTGPLSVVGAALVVFAVLVATQLVAVPLLCRRFGGGSSGTPPQYPQFLVVGDWGREGGFNQSVVAEAMARKAASMGRVDFIISTGDNFYPSGIVSPSDPAFVRSFTDVYRQPSLQHVPWYAVLGNHDYGQTDDDGDSDDPPVLPPASSCGADASPAACFYSPLHELDVRLAAHDARWHCRRTFQLALAGGAVELFSIDTTPLLLEYRGVPWNKNRGGLLEQSWEGQLAELEGALAASTAAWKLVVGHHPIRTTHRPFSEWAEMVRLVEPLLLRYGAQIYFNGHDHNLQHIYAPAQSSSYHQVCSGAGSKVGAEFPRRGPPALFQYGGNGFVAVRMGPTTTTVEYLGVDPETPPLFTIDITVKGGAGTGTAHTP